jgi:hypothetical protein
VSPNTVRRRRTVPSQRRARHDDGLQQVSRGVRCYSARGATARQDSSTPSRGRFPPNSGNTAPLLGNTDSGHCADKAAHGHIQAVDMHINFSIEKTTERSWR